MFTPSYLYNLEPRLTAAVWRGDSKVKQTPCVHTCHLQSVIRAQFMTIGSISALIIILFGQWDIHSGSITSLFAKLTKGIDSMAVNGVVFSTADFTPVTLRRDTDINSPSVHMVI